MTEQDYLASTSPSDLFAHLEAAGLATEPLCRRFVEACRATWRPDLNWSEDGLVNWRERAAIWCSRSRIHGGIADPKDDAVIAGFIRCIWGNVFRVCSKCKGTGSRERWNHKGNDVSSVQISRCKDCCGKGYPINPDWLTHANGLVPKLARVLHGFARRLQVQERLTAEVAQCIWDHLQPQGVAVVIEASHACMTARGVRTPGVRMTTSRMMGVFREDQKSREEVLKLMGY